MYKTGKKILSICIYMRFLTAVAITKGLCERMVKVDDSWSIARHCGFEHTQGQIHPNKLSSQFPESQWFFTGACSWRRTPFAILYIKRWTSPQRCLSVEWHTTFYIDFSKNREGYYSRPGVGVCVGVGIDSG